jgi:proline iminopeptidase
MPQPRSASGRDGRRRSDHSPNLQGVTNPRRFGLVPSHVAEVRRYVRVLGYRLFVRIFGSPTKGTLLCLHGGPGASHDYLTPFADLARSGYRVVMFDQLGCGRSQVPKDPSLFTIAHNVEEVEGIRRRLGVGKVFLLGSSYGGALAIAYALKYQRNLRGLIVASGLASIPLTVREMNRLRRALPNPVRRTMARYERAGDFENPEYQKAVQVFYERHLCRLKPWPRDVVRSLQMTVKRPVYHIMNGPNEFTITGTIRDWDVTDRLKRIRVPTLITVGKYDEVTPKVALSIHRGIRGSRLAVFNKSSHLAFWEERPAYMRTLRTFLATVLAD